MRTRLGVENKTAALALILLVLVFFALGLAPSIVEGLFHRGEFGVLNTLCRAPDGEHSLAYYQGLGSERVIGPLSQGVSAVWLLIFVLNFLKETGPVKLGMVVFLFLVVTKAEVLLFPPYGDAVNGPFAEAIWLYRHSFDYTGLFHQPNFAQGGPRVYMFSIYPTFLAGLMKLIPHIKTFLVVNHLLMFACTAAVTGLLYSVLRRRVAGEFALLACLIFVFLPLVQSQTEAINREIPSLLFALLSARYLADKNLRWSAVWAVVSLLVKGSGVFACAAVTVCGVLLFWADESLKRDKWNLFWAFVPSAAALGRVALKFLVRDQHAELIFWMAGWRDVATMGFFWLFTASLAFFVVRGYQNLREIPFRAWGERIRRFVAENAGQVVMFGFALVWFTILIHFKVLPYRYRVSVSPFVVYAVMMAVWRWGIDRRHLKKILTGLAVIAACSAYGFFYPSVSWNDHVVLERSLEYRNDLKLYQKVAAVVQAEYAHKTIAAPFTLAQALALPELGYVYKELDVMIYGMTCTYGGIKNFAGLTNDIIRNTIWVGLKEQPLISSDVKLPGGLPYPVGPNDRVISRLEMGNKSATLFLGGAAIEKLRLMIEYLRKWDAYQRELRHQAVLKQTPL